MLITALTIVASSVSVVMSRTNDWSIFKESTGNLFQIAQTGIPSAEVIHRKAHADGFERAEHRDGRFGMLHEHAFR